MASKRKLVKELEKLSKRFLKLEERKILLASLRDDQTEWFVWISQMKGVLKNINKTEAIKFSGLLLLLEQSPESKFYQDKLKKFLIDRTEFYKYYDFNLEKKLAQKANTRKNLWTSKILRLFISRSFLGIIIVILVLSFIVWFYIDKESCLEFVDKVVGPFLKAIK